jgi:hypothetical protein
MDNQSHRYQFNQSSCGKVLASSCWTAKGLEIAFKIPPPWYNGTLVGCKAQGSCLDMVTCSPVVRVSILGLKMCPLANNDALEPRYNSFQAAKVPAPGSVVPCRAYLWFQDLPRDACVSCGRAPGAPIPATPEHDSHLKLATHEGAIAPGP